MLAIAVFCAILQCGFNLIVDFLFDNILAAQTSKKSSVTRSIGSTIRKIGHAIKWRSNSVAPTPSPTDGADNKIYPEYNGSGIPNDYEVHGLYYHSKDRDFPSPVIKLHESAANSIVSLRRGFLEPLDRFDSTKNSPYCTVFGVTVENPDEERSYEILMEKIAIQRGSMNAIERRAFDTAWRCVLHESNELNSFYEPNLVVSKYMYYSWKDDDDNDNDVDMGAMDDQFSEAEVFEDEVNPLCTGKFCLYGATHEIILRTELDNANKEAVQRVLKLSDGYNKMDIGFDVLRLFVMDIMGRNSRKAALFKQFLYHEYVIPLIFAITFAPLNGV